MQLDKWQNKVLETSGNICLRSGRQVGKSTCISILVGEYALKNPNKTIMVIASVERQAQLLFEKILAYIHLNNKAKIMTGAKRPTKHKLRLKNGAIVHCLPTGESGYGIRGYTIDLLVADEAAFIPEDVWTAVTPMIATRTKFGARIILLSTPFGREGYFARCFRDKTFTNFHVSSEACDRIDQTFLAQERDRMTKRQYAQEYLGEFVDDLMQWFPDELIKKCMTERRDVSRGKGDLYLGVDIARMGEDDSTFQILIKQNDNLFHIENIITRKTLTTMSTRTILALDRKYNFRKIYIDDGGLGVGVFDQLLEDRQTRRKIVAVNNLRRAVERDERRKKKLLKEDLYNNMLNLMERGKIHFLDDPEVYQSLKSVQYEYTGGVNEERKLKIFGHWTHVAEGLIRAAWCIKDKSLNIRIDYI